MSYTVKVDAAECDPRAVDPVVYGRFDYARDPKDRTIGHFYFRHSQGVKLFVKNFAHLNPLPLDD